MQAEAWKYIPLECIIRLESLQNGWTDLCFCVADVHNQFTEKILPYIFPYYGGHGLSGTRYATLSEGQKGTYAKEETKKSKLREYTANSNNTLVFYCISRAKLTPFIMELYHRRIYFVVYT